MKEKERYGKGKIDKMKLSIGVLTVHDSESVLGGYAMHSPAISLKEPCRTLTPSPY